MTLSEDFNGPVTLMAAYNDEDQFLGLLADSQAGLFGRASGGWITVAANNRFFSGANIVHVDEDFLEFFDKLDARGNEPTMKQVNSYMIEAEYEETASEPEPEPAEEPVVEEEETE